METGPRLMGRVRYWTMLLGPQMEGYTWMPNQHSTVKNANMHAYVSAGIQALHSDDIAGTQAFYSQPPLIGFYITMF